MEQEKSELWSWIKTIGVTIVFVIAIRGFILTPIEVRGASMQPNYEDGDHVIVNKIGKVVSDFDRFDVIVFRVPTGENYIKRVIGVPGDHVAYQDDVLYINNEAVAEPYLEQFKQALLDQGEFTYDFQLQDITGEMTIPAGYYFVLGDNRRVSNDSRNPNVGLIAEQDILGSVTLHF